MLVIYLLSVVALVRGGNVSQETIDYISTFVDITLDPVDNTARDINNYVPLILTLRNTGAANIRDGDWNIYFNIMYGAKIEDTECKMHVGHVNGLLYYLKPMKNFILVPKAAISCQTHILKHGSARSDFMPNWYVASPGYLPKVIKCTTSEEANYVGAFDLPSKWKTDILDQYHPLTSGERYRKNQKISESNNRLRIIPSPLKMSKETGFCILTDQWVVKTNAYFQRASKTLSDLINVPMSEESANNQKEFEFVKNEFELSDSNIEAYKIDVKATCEKVKITAISETGAFYAVQTVVQMLNTSEHGEKVLPIIKITDRPRYKHRGLMIDIARNFHGDSIKPIIDIMARYKMNKLHLHVTDDEGWRLEIPSIPELTEIGSKRCHESSEDIHCLIPSHGSGPNTNTSGTGYITVGKFRDILQHAEHNHISVILELDMPGHSRAAWRSMNIAGRNLTFGRKYYRVDDLDDLRAEDGESVQRWRRSSLNPCLESTYSFVDTIVRDIVLMYKGIQDLEQLHIGADEVVFAEWTKSKTCQKYFNKNFTVRDLNMMFVERTLKILLQHGVKPVLWEDLFFESDKAIPVDRFIALNVSVQTWYNIWELGSGSRPIELANMGYDTIMSPATHLYLGHAQEPDPEEHGLYWATRFSDTFKIFSFNSRNIYQNIDTSRFGEPLTKSDVCNQFTCSRLDNPNKIKGIEACLFTETIRTENQLFYMLLPRLFAVSERAWHEAIWESIENVTERDISLNEDWMSFKHELGNKHLQQLPFYRVPPPGALFNGSHLNVNVLYENHAVEVSLNCTTPWSVISDTLEISKISGLVCLRSRPLQRNIYSRVIRVSVEESLSSMAMTSRCFTFYVWICCLHLSLWLSS